MLKINPAQRFPAYTPQIFQKNESQTSDIKLGVLSCDFFTPSFTGAKAYGDVLRNILCKKFNISESKFSSTDRLNKWAAIEYKKLTDFNSIIYNRYNDEQKSVIRRFAVNMDKYMQDGDASLKKLLLLADFLTQKDELYIVPFNKKIMHDTFEEIINENNSNNDIYQTYKNILLNSDQLQLRGKQLGQKFIVTNEYKISTGEMQLSPDGYISNLQVFPEYRHSRASKRTLNILFDMALQTAKAKNLDKLYLHVLTENIPAASGYINKQNFQVVDFDVTKKAQLMEKTLKSHLLSAEEIQKRRIETERYIQILKSGA